MRLIGVIELNLQGVERSSGFRIAVLVRFVRDLALVASPFLDDRRNLSNGRFVFEIAGPDRNSVQFGPDVDHSTAHLVAFFAESLADQTQQDFEPQIVQIRFGVFADQEDQTPASFVSIVFPHGFDAAFEDIVVTVGRQHGRHFYVVVDSPEVFD